MSDKYLQFSQTVLVSVNDCDFAERLKPSAIMSYFQDTATEHANYLNIGYDDMTAQNLVWIMSRMCFKVFRHPRIGEELTVKTYPEQPQTADVARGYYIFDKAGNKVVAGSSRWAVLAKDTRKIQRCAPMFEGRGYDYIPFKPFDDANKKVEALDFKAAKRVGGFSVQVTDLDRNVHLNNTRFGDIVLNAAGYDFIKKHAIERFDINFLAESFIGDTIEVYAVQKDKEIVVEAVRDKEGQKQSVFRAEAMFVKKQG